MVEIKYTGEALWDRKERAVEKVNERLRKTVAILEQAKVPYAIVGGHAVRALAHSTWLEHKRFGTLALLCPIARRYWTKQASGTQSQ